MRIRSLFLSACAASLALVLSLQCSNSTGPGLSRGTPGVTVVRGGGQTDTVLAKLAQALVLQIRDTTGAVAVGEIVRFLSVPVDTQPYVLNSVSVAGLSNPFYGGFFAESTNSKGEASVLIQLGLVAGSGRVAVTVPQLGYQDTVSYTILPGSATHLVVTPRDTAVYVGGIAALHAYAADAEGNRRNDAITYQGLDAATTVTPSGLVTGASIGRSLVLAKAPSPAVQDTARISVVPQGTIAAVGAAFGFPAGSIVIVNLDGSGARAIPQSVGDNNYLQWSPAGSSLIFFRPAYIGHEFSIDLSGTTTQLIPGGTFAEDNWGRYAANGSYIYFRGAPGLGYGYIYRVLPDGTGLDTVPGPAGTWPAPSPDGARVVYVDNGSGLHVYTYATAADTALLIFQAAAPHWSPDGNWIAYSNCGCIGGIELVKPDGTGQHLLGQETYDMAFDWSPDSQWLIGYTGANLELVQVSSGLRLPLAFTAGLTSPSWKP